jgi:hopanoid biosynthesis associated RND transporter like protein HpnN
VKGLIDEFLARWLARWVDAVRERATAVATGILVLTAAFAVYSFFFLGINSDNLSLLSDNLAGRQYHFEFTRHFPDLEEALFIVVDGETPELAREAADALVERLSQEPEVLTDVYLPGGGDFFERNGLMYRTPEDLDVFADQMARIQPLLAELELDPSIATMVEIVELGLDERGEDASASEQWSMVLDRVSDATVAVYEEFPLAISWEELLLQGSAIETSTRRTIVAHPILDYSHILQARHPINRIREIAEELDLRPERGVRVRITGNPALNGEEMMGFLFDIGGAGVFCFLFVTVVLYRAFRCIPLVIAAVVTLFSGLIWAIAFAAAAVGAVNVLSIAFAILFIGLGVDFAIHLGMGYADLLRQGRDHASALRETSAHVGAALFFCTITTSVGFYVFVFTEYKGLNELGLIAGTGMFVIFFMTLTFFPALVSCWTRVDPERHLKGELRMDPNRLRWFHDHPRAIRWTALGVGIVAIALLPGVRFDVNVVEMRDPDTESVQAFKDLLAKSDTSPWYLNVLTPDLTQAEALAERLDALDSVKRAITLASYVPEDQEEKLAILADVAFLLEAPPIPLQNEDDPTIEEQTAALRSLYTYLGQPAFAAGDRPLANSVQRLREHIGVFLERVEIEGDPEAALRELERVLLASLPRQLERLRRALEPEPISLESLPAEIRERMITEDGVARVQVLPATNMKELEDFVGFVHEVQSVAPRAAGVPLNLVEFGEVTSRSFRQALISAFFAIGFLLWMLWRSLTDTVLVMIPLSLGAAMTGAAMAVLDIRFDFTNVVVIPLLFGIGVDSAIHLVQRAKEGLGSDGGIMGTASARAIWYSALTTTVSFGSLGFAGHNGMSSLGIALTIGLISTTTCVLIVLPALLALRHPELDSGS